MRVTRRKLLGGSCSALTVVFAGCLSSNGGAELGNEPECDDANRSSVEAERAIPPADVREEVVPIQYEELPTEEQDVAAMAIRGNSYEECSPESDAFESFLDRIEDHRDEQQRQSDADLTTVYLVRTRTYYALTATKLDQRISY